MKIRKALLSLLALALTGFSLMSMISNQPAPYQQLTNNHQPDSFTTAVAYSEYDETGLLHMHLTATKSIHYPDHESSDLQLPNITIYNEKRIPWYISSKTAHTINNNAIIHLKDNVRFYRPPIQQYPTTTILTSRATILPQKQYGETKQATIILRPNSTTHSKGLTINFKDNIIDFPSDATSVFQPADQTENKHTTKEQ